MKRNFTPEGPDRSVGRGHITYVRTWEGWLYLSFVLDTYSRRVVGWSMANPISGPRAGARCAEHGDIYIHTRRPQPPGLIHHCDRGSQYASVEFGSRLKRSGSVALDGICG